MDTVETEGRRTHISDVVLIGLCVFLTGCGGGEQKEGLVPAYGTVTLDGAPLAYAQVVFVHATDGTAIGRTDGEGYYEMAYTFSQEGAFTGENRVYLSTRDVEQADGTLQTEETVPQQYREGNSELTVMVKDGGAPYDLDLTSTAPSGG